MSTQRPKILYDNRLDDATPVASSTAVGYDVLNLRDWAPYTWWKPTALPATVKVNCGAAKKADYGFLYGHNLISAHIGAIVEASDDDFATFNQIASSNVVDASETLTDAAWAKTGATAAADRTINEAGDLTVDEFYEDVSTGVHQISQSVKGWQAGSICTLKVKIRRASGVRNAALIIDTGGGTYSYIYGLFDFDTKQVSIATSSATGVLTSFTAEAIRNGFYLLTLKGIPGTDGTSANAMVRLRNGSNDSYLGDGFSGMYVKSIEVRLSGPVLKFGQEFDNAAWSKSNCSVIANAANDPITGNAIADEIREASDVAKTHEVYEAIHIPANKSCTLSLYIKRSSGTRNLMMTLTGQGEDTIAPSFDLTNGVVHANGTTKNGVITASSITSVGSGWYKVSVTGIVSPYNRAIYCYLTLLDSGFGAGYNGDGTSGLYFSQAWIEVAEDQPAYQSTSAGAADVPLYLPFRARENQYYRWKFVQLSGSTMPSVSIGAIGEALEFPKFLARGFDPIGRDVRGPADRTEAGHPLGRVIDFEEWTETLQFKNLTQDWLRDTFLPAWKAHLRSRPYGFVWDPGDHADEIYLVSSGNTLKTPHQGGPWVDLSLAISGVVP